MRKKIILLLITVGLFFPSCEDAFDFGSDGRVTYDEIFSDYLLTGKYLTTAYSYFPYYGASSAGGTFLASFTDEAQDAQDVVPGSNSLKYYEGNMNSASNLIKGSLYDNMFKGIRTCNVFLARVDDVPSFTIQEHRGQWKAEAYLLRAYYYLQLIKRYGPMPIFKEELPLDYDFSTMERPSFYENVQAIIADCDAALAQPELLYRQVSGLQDGYMTRGVAYAIKSQAILFAASPLWNDGNDHWAEAATVTKEALDALEGAGYGLFNPSNTSIPGLYSKYQEYFLTQPESVEFPSVEKETILGKSRMTLWSGYSLPILADVTKAGISPSQELVDAYETIDGVPVLDPTMPYLDDAHLQPNYNSANTMYDPENPYANRDPRLFSTIYCNGNFHNLSNNTIPVETYVGGSSEISDNSNLNTRTGYYLRKFIHYDSRKNSNKDGFWHDYRMAEMYLNFAEADFYAKGAVTTEALAAVNTIRSRAGMPDIQISTSTSEFELKLRNERRVELAFEEHRYYDLRRWKIQSDFEGIVTGMKITKNGEDFEYDRIVVQERNITDEKYLMWPIPLTEQNKYNALGVEFQNEGW
ncbi:Starch-binding associating with outer membrane [Algibacter lectus]|uniref:RagB/SusD family nutrient uptake outer membrane protein n=1 Tax=Algibacter lectus TaxID=221126 RepID=UPI0008E0C076|nr:RagB/SusD family nutrient uptake outer membrane protein [Algibacter lectus]SFB88501.1 Starch-binding associating with outer membrane [Algibacter lectus]